MVGNPTTLILKDGYKRDSWVQEMTKKSDVYAAFESDRMRFAALLVREIRLVTIAAMIVVTAAKADAARILDLVRLLSP